MPYTCHDTPQVKKRIEDDLQHARKTVCNGDPALRALVLTGGFARGEGSVLDGAPQNDYDFVAIRGLGRSKVPYPEMVQELEEDLGLHIDLAPVASWRLPFVSRSIFWYETALRGKVLWGLDPMHRIPIRSADDLDPSEGLRLLVNRAAGLLLATAERDPHAVRIQASKGILGAMDAHLLAMGSFAPSQRERWERYELLRARRQSPALLEFLGSWLHWAYRFKTRPEEAPRRDAWEAWETAARAVMEAVPVALRHAGFASLDAYARQDSLVERLYYYRNALAGRRVSPFVWNPTGQVRVGTLRVLGASLDGSLDKETATRHLGPLAPSCNDPIEALTRLRSVTMQ